MERGYHITEKENTETVRGFLSKNGQALLPLVEQIEQAEVALDELVDVPGRATVEMVLHLSAERIAGPPHPGKKGGAVAWHGGEEGTVCLKERKLRVKRPAVAKEGPGRRWRSSHSRLNCTFAAHWPSAHPHSR